MRYHEIKIETNEQSADIVAASLLDLGIDSYEVVGGEIPEEGSWDYIDESLLTPQPDAVFVRIFLEDNADYPLLFKKIKATLSALTGNFGSLIVVDSLCDDSTWKDKWKAYFIPFKAGEKIVISPQWEEYAQKPDEIVIKIDPGAAFGSGLHETTKMCIRALEKYVTDTTDIIDVGCGSGILAIAAAKLGARSVLAMDVDDISVKVARENAVLNGASDIIVKQSDLLKNAGTVKADIVVANLVADLIIQLNHDMMTCLKKDGIYIVSGIITERLDDVTESLASSGFEIITIEKMGEWRAITATPKS